MQANPPEPLPLSVARRCGANVMKKRITERANYNTIQMQYKGDEQSYANARHVCLHMYVCVCVCTCVACACRIYNINSSYSSIRILIIFIIFSIPLCCCCCCCSCCCPNSFCISMCAS